MEEVIDKKFPQEAREVRAKVGAARAKQIKKGRLRKARGGRVMGPLLTGVRATAKRVKAMSSTKKPKRKLRRTISKRKSAGVKKKAPKAKRTPSKGKSSKRAKSKC